MRSIRPVRWLWLVTALFCVALVIGFPWLRGDVPWLPGDSAWRWPYELPRFLWLLPCVAGLAVYTLGAAHLLNQAQNERTRYPLRLILWSFVGAALLPLLLMTLEGRPLFLLFTRSASTLTGGNQYAANLVTDLGDTLRHWPQFVMNYREKIPLGGIALSPPGLVVVYDTFQRFFAIFPSLATTFDALVRPLECQNLYMMTWSPAQMASAWFQMFMPLWAALGVAPLYRLGRYLFDHERARLVVALWPLVPGMAIFTPRFNVFYPLLTLVMLLALWRGLTRHRLRQIFLAGFVLSVGIFFNLSLVPLGLLAGLFILGYALLNRESVVRPALNLVVFGAGCGLLWLVYWALSGVSPLDIFQQGMALHLILNRPYLPWLFMHPYDMFLFVGLPVSALVFWRVWHIRRLRQSGKMGAQLLTGAGALTLLIMVLSGTARGETGRVWLFFAPVWVLLAADVLAGFRQQERVSILAMQALCLLSMAAVLRANFTTLTVPASPPAADRAATFPVNARFALGPDAVTLAGLDVEAAPSTVTLRLHWRADTYVRGPYVLMLTSVAPDGSPGANVTWNPLNTPDWDYPPSCWLPGHEFVDTVNVPLGDKPRPGNWLFSLSIADVYTRDVMPVTGPDGESSLQVGIGPVNVPAH